MQGRSQTGNCRTRDCHLMTLATRIKENPKVFRRTLKMRGQLRRGQEHSRIKEEIHA